MGFKQGFLFMSGAILALAVIFLIIGNTSAQNTAPAVNMSIYTGTLSVSGTGYVFSEPDLAKVTIGVTTEAVTSTQAMGDNANAMDNVINAIKAQGIPASDIKTSRVSLQPKYEYQYPTTSSSSPDKAVPPTSLSTRIVGYTATNTVTVTVRDMSKVGGVIDAGYNGGANQIQGVTFTLSDEKAATVYKQALQKAVAQATDKAKVIASASGVGEIKLKSISESGQYYPVAYDGMERSAMASGAVAPTPISPGEQQVSATVSMTYVYIPQ
jgi:uncharacterized protein YggE